MITAYKILGIMLIPLIKINIILRINKKKELKNRYTERYGIPSVKRPKKKLIWIHAASIGEFKSADILINKYYLNYTILVTTTTVSAAEYALEKYSDKIIHQFAPLDVSFWVDKFLKYWKPDIVLWIESDLWPTITNLIKENKIKAILLNVRISPKSFLRWKKIKFLYNEMVSCFSVVYAQSKLDQKRITTLTNKNIEYIGNLKLAILKNNTKIRFNSSINKSYTTLMLSSTHKEEEAYIVNLVHQIKNKFQDLKIIIAPRHLNRSKEIQKKLSYKKILSQIENEIDNDNDIVIINSFGKLSKYYEESDIVFLGGSLVPKGGHNPIEPALYNCAILTGNQIFNWQNIFDEMIQFKACKRIKNLNELISTIKYLLENKKEVEKLKKEAYNFTNKINFNSKQLFNNIERELMTRQC